MDKDKEPIQYHNLTVLTNETAEELYKYLAAQYVAYHKYPRLIELLKVLREKFHNG